MSESRLGEIALALEECHQCPRLVEWRQQVSLRKRSAFRDQVYWGRPVAGFGDPQARMVLVGLAPAAHGANRTGRMFTGDRSGDWLYRALHNTGLASQAFSVSADDGLELSDVWVTSAVRCAPPDNKPTTLERDTCASWLAAELDSLPNKKVLVALGGFGYQALFVYLRSVGALVPRPLPKFSHGVEVELEGLTVLGSYHPSQQNTFTGRLTEDMLDGVFRRACELVG